MTRSSAWKKAVRSLARERGISYTAALRLIESQRRPRLPRAGSPSYAPIREALDEGLIPLGVDETGEVVSWNPDAVSQILFLGPEGSGKSTAAQSILRMAPLTSRTVTFVAGIFGESSPRHVTAPDSMSRGEFAPLVIDRSPSERNRRSSASGGDFSRSLSTAYTTVVLDMSRMDPDRDTLTIELPVDGDSVVSRASGRGSLRLWDIESLPDPLF